MNDNKRKLYDALSNDYDMGTYEQFRKDLEDKDKRRKLYDATSDAYDFGDYDQFEAQLGYSQSPSAPGAEEINSASAGPVMPKPAMENRNWDVQMGNGHSSVTVERPEPVDVPIPQRPEGQEPSDDGTAAPSGDVRSYLEYANRQQVANLSRDISSRLDEAQTKSRDIYMKEQEDARKGGFLSTLAHAIAASGHNPEGRSGGMSDAQQRTLQGANSELQSEISKLEAAKKAMSNAEEMIAEADKSVQERKFPGFFKGIARGFGDKLFDVNTWDMGVSDTKNSIELLKALRKYDEGKPLSESEQMLLDAKSVELATNAYFGSYIGRGYKAGAVTAQSLPFMLEMAVNPASTLGESTQSMLARYALSRFAKKGATRAAQKFATKAAGAAGRALGDIAGSAVMAGTSGAVRVAGDAIDRHVGDIETDMDGQGQTVFAGHDPESLGKSIAKAFTSTAIENHSEMLGEYFAPALGIVSKLGRKGMEKFGLKKVVDFVDDVSATDAAKLIADFQKRTKWNGTIGEYAEEVAGNIENAILVGDNTLDASDDTGVFNLDQNIDTFLGVALMGGVFSTARTIGWRTPKYRARMEMEEARNKARTKYGSEAWQEIEDRMAEAGDDGMSAVLSTVIAGENSPEKAKALLDYAKSIKKYEGMLAGDEKRREIASPEATDLETSYENGYTLSTPQEVHDAKLMFEYQEAMLQKALGTSDIDIDTIMLGNEMGTLTDKQKSVAMDYLNAKATFDGVIDRVRDDIDSRISSVENAIDASTNRDTGMLQPASLVDDRPVHIISGIVRLTPDGTMVDTRNSENFIIVRDDKTGRMETISPSDINRLENEIDPAMEKQTARQQIQDVYGSREADSIDGVLAFNPGDTYTLTNGQGQSFPVQIVANEQGATDNGDGTVNVVLNNDIDTQTGQPRITQMPKEQIQEMAEATNLSRLQQYEQQKLARAAEQAETDATGRTPENPFRINDRITLSDAETGKVENGVVGSELTDDGKYEVVVEKQDGSQSILYLSPSELEQLGAKLEQPVAVEEQNAPVLEQKQPVLEQKTDKAEQESAMSRIPLDRNGEPQFEQAQPSDTWKALLELNGGNAVEAEDTARQMYENASKNLDKAQKTKPKSGTSVMEIQRNKAERNGQIDELRKSVDFWGKVLSFPEAVRKSASAAAAAEVRQKEDAKREAVRQAKENLAKGRKLMQQKGTYYKDDAKLGDYLDFHDYALRMIANGRVKFVWKNDADNNSIKGLGGHLGLEDSESERKALFSLLANQDKGGLRPDDAAEQLSEEYNSSLGAEVISSSEALDVILDIIRTYGGKTRDMMNAAIDAHAMAGMDERGHDEDSQGNPINSDGSLYVESVSSIDEITDEDFTNPTRSIVLPEIPQTVDEAIGANGKPVVIKKNIFMRNSQTHPEVTPQQAREILSSALYRPDLYGQNQKTSRPYNWIVINTKDSAGQNRLVVLEVNENKDNVEIIHWYNARNNSIEQIKRQAQKEGGLILMLPSETEEAGGLSSRQSGLSSESKDTNISEESNTGSEKSVAEQITEQREVVNTEPTEAQKEAGNYRMGHVKIDGMDVTIENPKGSIRRGTDADGKKWESEMHYDYGYIRGTKAVDNDHIDIFLSDNPETGNVFVVDQVNPKTGEFDESKVMYGFSSEQEARDAYLSNYEKGWKGLGKITEVTREEFKKWIESSTRKTKPFSEYASVKTAEAQKEKGTSTEVSDSRKNNTSDKASERGFILMDDFIESALQEAYENRTDKSLSRDDWNEEDEAIDAENKANDDYYQYIESLSNSGELQKMYDASSIGEQIKMRKSIGEAGYEFKDLIDTTKAADARKEAREKKKKEEYRLKMKTLGIDIEDDDVQPSTKKPETQKEKPVQGLEGYSRDEIKGIVTDHINDVMRDYDIDAEIIGMDIHGSRNRHDARPDSDLDVVVEYSGDIREDDMFNALNGEEDALSIEGIKVDINPIRKEETGDLQDYMKQSEEYDKEKSEHANVKPLDGNAQKNIIVDAFREWNGNLRNKYRSSPQFSELDNAISIAKYQADEGNVKPDAQKNFERAVRLIPELYFGSGDIQFSIGKKNYETTSSGVKDFAEKYGVSQEAVEDYANGMRLGTGAGCGLALLNIRRDFRLANSTLKFAEFSREYAKLKQELFDKFGDYEKLKAQQIAEADARRDTMEAARKRIEEEQQRKKAEYEARIARYKGMSLEELDSEYFKALENNDGVSARDIVDEVARRNGYADVTSDYQGAGAWAAPSRPGGYTDEERRASLETGSPDLSLEDISLGYTMQPDDIFDHPERYMQSDSTSKEAARAIKATLNALKKGNKDAKIKVFRAVPLSVKEGRLRNGDWVTPSRAYADMHGNHRLEGEYRVIEEEVPAKDLWWDGNDVREWGYDDGTARRYANVENNTKLNDVITSDDAGNIIPPSRRFDSGNVDERYQISGRKAIDEGSEESRIAYEAVKEQFDRIGIPVELLSDQAMREMAINATMLDTALPEDESSFKGTVISSIDGAKILRNLDNAIDDYQNVGDKGTKTFLGDLASALGSSDKDKSSQYATFETKNGQVVTIRVSNHNATVSNFDNAGESNGISIVISRKPNEGITNDGDAHIVEFFYPDKALNKAEGKPLVEILKSIKQSLYSGEYKDTTGLAQREEVNDKESVEFLREPDGTVYGATVGGKIYLNRERLNPNTPIHEYTHLWFSALEKANPELYKRGVELMKQLPIWEEVKTDPNYANLSGDDAIASECLSRLVGDKGAEKLTELAKKAMVRGDIIGTANRISLIEEFKDWLKKFWTWVRDSFAPWSKEEASMVSVDDIQNMVLSDLVKGVNPLANAREESELKKTNDKFNEQLETFTIETADRYNFNLGRPSSVLLSAGIENKPIRLHGSKVAKKIRKHGFPATALRDLPKAIAHPIAVFDNLGREGNRSILTELKTDNGNVIVSIDLGRGTEVDFNIVSSVFGKNSKGVLGWINGGKMKFVDKEKALNYLHLSAPIAEASDNAELLSAANIVKEFENPSDKERKPEFQFIGEKGAAHMDKVEEATIRLDNLSIARQMEDAGKDAKTIKLATGWERGADGKWRYEISDANIKDTVDLGKGISKKRFEEDMLWNSGRLGNVIEAPELFKAYPQLKDVHIETDSIVNDMPSNGEFNANLNRITIHAYRLKYLNSILNHEIQHAIQHIEGFATGGTPEHVEKEFDAAKTEWRARAYAHELEETAKELGGEYNLTEVENALGKEYKEMGMEDLLPDKETRIKGANYFARGYADRSMDEAIKRFRLDESAGSDFNPYVEYMHIAGEVEARNVSARLGMTPEERRRTLALETEDVSREDQIILNDALNGDSHYEEEPEIDRIVRESKDKSSRTAQDFEAAAAKLAESLGEKVRIVRDVNEIENRNEKVQENQRRSKGWFNTGTGEIVVVLPNATGIEDVQATILHEAVGHKGLRELVGDDRFDDFLDKVYAAATKATRLEIVGLARRNHWDFRLATEEYIAGMAEKGFSGRENRTLFGKIKDFFRDMLSRAKIALGFNVGDNELRYMLWRTYQMRTSRGILAKANDMTIQQELKVGNFREDQLRGRNGFTENDIAEMETPILESRGTFAKLADAEKWAKENLQGKTFVNSFTGDEINISGHSIKEMLAPKFSKAINEKTHMAAIMSVPDFIETGIPAEIHKDTHGRGYDVMRLYNAIVIDGEPYRVKSTVKRYVDGDRYYTYEIQEMELLKGTQTTALGLDDSSRPQLQSSITGANLLKGVKKTNSDEEILSGDDSRLRFRTSGKDGSSNTARDIYEEKTRVIDKNGRKSDTANLMRRLKEAYVDSMQSLKYLQDAISEETGKPVEDFENAYLAENSMSSKNKAQTDIYLNRFFNPIKDAIRDLQKEGAEYGDIVRYLMAKHGLERNEVFSKRDAEKDGGVWDGSVRRDYSGLTELTRKDTDTVAPRIDEITSRAEDIVRKFEMDHDTDVLWEKINAATKDTLRTSYITGMLTKDNYEMVRSMFRYYIPLRGWSENTASAVYDYLSYARPKTSSIVKAATGRTTISDDPIATIAYMGQSAIIQGNRNLMKQKLLNLALNHKTGLLTVSRQWEVLDPVTGMWTPRDPDIPADAAPEQVADIVADFEKDMKEAEKKGVARLSRGKLDTGKHLTTYEGQEHIIKVKRGGIDYSIYLNGNPRAAQAVNGMTNPDAVDSWLIRKARVIKNFMARMFTSQNPAFIISNLSLDVIFAGTAVYAKEDAKYAARYAKNITVALAKGQLIGLIHRFETDRLDNSKDLDRYFGEFIRNGGETGFTQLNTVDDFKRDIDRFSREMKQGQVMKVSTKVWNGIWDGIEYMNRCAEDATRFSVYMTSRQMGRSVERSISDAKEITVNFNRKGSGGYGARLMNFAYIFFNAAVQSLANAGKIMYEHPMKALAALGAFSAAGFMAPLLAQAIISAFGGDDDAYWDLPEWVRRNNFVFYIPWSDNKFLIIPISQELRPFYAMGEIAMSVLMGKEEVLDGLKSAAGSFMDLLPIDFMGNGGNLAISLTPTVAQPFAQLVANTDYFGSPIYRRNDYNKLDPAWTKAYKGTSPMLVNASKWLNEVTGGDDVKRGWIDPINNPAVIEHLFESYLGGTGKTINRAAKTFSMIWNPDMRDIRNVPIASTFIQESDDERVAGNQLNREYFKLMDEFKETSHTVSGYKKKARMGSMEYADKLNEFMETPDFERYSKARGYANTISKLRQALKRAQESGEDVMVEENLQQILHDLKRQMVEELKEQ